MPTHKRRDDGVEAASRRTSEGQIEQVDSAGKGLPVEEEDTYVSHREGVAGTNVNKLTRPR